MNIIFSKNECEYMLRQIHDECAVEGRNCPKHCINLKKPCILIHDRVEKKLLEAFRNGK